MMNDLSWAEMKRQVFARAKGCCEYCQTCEHNIGQPMHVEHIIPDGGDTLENLCLSCASCNLSKSTATQAVDPVTENYVALFNPRTQQWQDHFEWHESGIWLVGKTDIGRASVQRLKMNQDRVVRARRNWVKSGTHPPQ
jgi:hypothetical protein